VVGGDGNDEVGHGASIPGIGHPRGWTGALKMRRLFSVP
jgi:hypothetical protein